MADFQIAEMAGAVLPSVGEVYLANVLRENVARLETLYHERARYCGSSERASRAFRERTRSRRRWGFLPETRIQAAHNFVLTERRTMRSSSWRFSCM